VCSFVRSARIRTLISYIRTDCAGQTTPALVYYLLNDRFPNHFPQPLFYSRWVLRLCAQVHLVFVRAFSKDTNVDIVYAQGLDWPKHTCTRILPLDRACNLANARIIILQRAIRNHGKSPTTFWQPQKFKVSAATRGSYAWLLRVAARTISQPLSPTISSGTACPSPWRCHCCPLLRLLLCSVPGWPLGCHACGCQAFPADPGLAYSSPCFGPKSHLRPFC
jgi:hypothetical protein